MLTSTFLAVLFVPVFYVVFQQASERWASRRPPTAAAPADADGNPVDDRRGAPTRG